MPEAVMCQLFSHFAILVKDLAFGKVMARVSKEVRAKPQHKLVQELKEIQSREAGSPFARVEAMEVKLSSLDSVRRFCASFNERNEPLHFLILNAGVMGANSERETTEDGLEQHFQASQISQ